MERRICNKCKINRPLHAFYFRQGRVGSDGHKRSGRYSRVCKFCEASASKEWSRSKRGQVPCPCCGHVYVPKDAADALGREERMREILKEQSERVWGNQ